MTSAKDFIGIGLMLIILGALFLWWASAPNDENEIED